MLHTYQMKTSECTLDDNVPVGNVVKMNIIGLNGAVHPVHSIESSGRVGGGGG